MARPIEYDINKVLDNAMDIFWQKGYAGVTMADIVEHTGLNRRTMYSLFKDKEGLFKDALDHYYHKLFQHKLAVLRDNPGKRGIELFFKTFTFSEDFKGCLFSNSIREKDFIKMDTYAILKEYFERVKEQMQINLEQAIEKDEFHGNPEAMALTIITFIHGFNVYGKYNPSKEDSDALFQNVIGMIR